MKKLILRSMFYLGVVIFLVLNYFMFTLPSDEYDVFLNSSPATVLYLGFGFSMLFYLYAMVHSVIDIVMHRKPVLKWLVLVLCVPVIGAYIYFERHLFDSMMISSSEVGHEIVTGSDHSRSSAITGWMRVVAALIDYALFFIILGSYASLFGDANGGVFQVKGTEALLLVFGLWSLLFPLCEFLFEGTIGKRLLGLRVKMQNGGRIVCGAAFKRHILDIVDILLLAWMIPVAKKEQMPQRLGDKWAKTIVTQS